MSPIDVALKIANAESCLRYALADIARLKEALIPLAAIADAWEVDGLDESRPYWIEKGVEKRKPLEQIELFSGRGGKQLLTLADAMRARDALRSLK